MTKRYSDLRTYLTHTDTTQEELAKRLGISQAHLSQIVNGLRKPSVDVALRIEDATGISIRSLVNGNAA